jgi:hypothetical protein
LRPDRVLGVEENIENPRGVALGVAKQLPMKGWGLAFEEG